MARITRLAYIYFISFFDLYSKLVFFINKFFCVEIVSSFDDAVQPHPTILRVIIGLVSGFHFAIILFVLVNFSEMCSRSIP